jgi:F-type H+-transporting ATPase subunit c
MEHSTELARMAAYFGAALAIGLVGVGTSLAQGRVGAAACENIGKYPESASHIRSAMFMAIAFIESAPIYALLICGAILYLGGR